MLDEFADAFSGCLSLEREMGPILVALSASHLFSFRVRNFVNGERKMLANFLQEVEGSLGGGKCDTGCGAVAVTDPEEQLSHSFQSASSSCRRAASTLRKNGRSN